MPYAAPLAVNKLLWPWSLRADSPRRAKEVDVCQVVASDQSLFEEDMLGTKIESFHVPANDGDVQPCVDMTGIMRTASDLGLVHECS